jgi:hypothetical protein
MSQTQTRADKKPYESPTVTVLGDIEAITLANACGSVLDATFTSGSPFGSVTCS